MPLALSIVAELTAVLDYAHRERAALLPECVEWAVAAALAKSPRDRPASGAELLRRLSH